MRRLLAGILLVLSCAAGTFAQAVGEVDSVGFNNAYRPDCWTPMVVRLRPQTAEAGTFQLQVWQHDLDGDRAVYTRTITLNGSDTAPDQRFWMYFLPQPTNKGLPDAATGGTLKDLQRELKVFLCTATGKQLIQLPITSTLQNVDPYRDFSQQPRGCKLVLAVSDGADAPAWRDYQTAVGMKEDVEFVNLTTKDLPEDPLGYEAVDSIAWFDADPADLDRGGQHKLQTLQDWLRFGGQLVICQPTSDWQKTLNFGALLPVTVTGVQTKPDLEPLRSMAHPRGADPFALISIDSWNRPVGPFAFARAAAKPGAVVDRWIDWKNDGSYSDASPYLVRQAIGLGQVTWVANDLGNPAISLRATTGWPYVWDTVFGWNNDTYVPPAAVSKDDPTLRARTDSYAPGPPIELGTPLVTGLNFDGKAATLITVALVFFILYGVVACGVAPFVLKLERKSGFNWFVFAAVALVATGLTGIVVKLAVRGPPQLKQISFVRLAPNQPALIYSRLGLYIPRDGDQTLTLNDTTHQGVSYLSSFAEHPQLLGDASEFPAPADYPVPVRDSDSTDAPSLTVPYRSSMKTFQSCWIGDPTARFTGKIRLDPQNPRVGLSGYLTNETGQDFADVYLAFHDHDQDRLIYLPKWNRSTSVDLGKDLIRPVSVGHLGNKDLAAYPGDGVAIADTLGDPTIKRGDSRERHWIGYWYGDFFHNNGLTSQEPKLAEAFPMLSLFDRLPPAWNLPPDGTHGKEGSSDRFELFRRGGRMLDASASVEAGQLLILASNTGPLPVPLQVDGADVGGTGTVLYQFLLPIDRGEAKPPSTQPSTTGG